MSETLDRPILWRPSTRQALFLSAAEEEVLYGGAAGGGKTDALAIDALGLQQQATSVPRYRAILVRRTFPEMIDLIDRTRSLYPTIIPGAVYREQAREWRFPSGAKVIFGAIEREQDTIKYQGQEYQYCGFEELTNWPTSYPWDFMRTRLRGTSLKIYMRATCNPGGVGGRWVQQRWQIPDDGSASRITLRVTVPGVGGQPERTIDARLRFIPARLADNAHISPSYAANLMRLPDQQRRALLDGRWDVYDVPGAIYATELGDLRDGGRLTRVPYDPAAPVYTAWDLGIGDATCVWFVQMVGREIHLIDYYEASGENLAHYVQVIAEKRDGAGWRFARHYLPHDVAARELMTGSKTREAFLRESKIGPIVVVRRGEIEDGIHAVTMLLPKAWVDEKHCAAGIHALSNYRRAYSNAIGQFVTAPVHDWASNGSDALRTLAMGLTAERAPRPPATQAAAIDHLPGGWMAR